jgi:hypothetical protein
VPFPLDGESFWPRNCTHPLWTALLNSCLGYLLSNPTINTKHVLPDFA